MQADEYAKEADQVKSMNEKESIEKEQHLVQMIKAVMGRKADPEVSERFLPDKRPSFMQTSPSLFMIINF